MVLLPSRQTVQITKARADRCQRVGRVVVLDEKMAEPGASPRSEDLRRVDQTVTYFRDPAFLIHVLQVTQMEPSRIPLKVGERVPAGFSQPVYGHFHCDQGRISLL